MARDSPVPSFHGTGALLPAPNAGTNWETRTERGTTGCGWGLPFLRCPVTYDSPTRPPQATSHWSEPPAAPHGCTTPGCPRTTPSCSHTAPSCSRTAPGCPRTAPGCPRKVPGCPCTVPRRPANLKSEWEPGPLPSRLQFQLNPSYFSIYKLHSSKNGDRLPGGPRCNEPCGCTSQRRPWLLRPRQRVCSVGERGVGLEVPRRSNETRGALFSDGKNKGGQGHVNITFPRTGGKVETFKRQGPPQGRGTAGATSADRGGAEGFPARRGQGGSRTAGQGTPELGHPSRGCGCLLNVSHTS